MTVQLNATHIESFAGMFLSPRYDQARPTAQFHREAWALYASSCPAAMVIAPRDHAKSTALTFDYVMAEALFRTATYIIVIGSTEEMAQEQLSNISDELQENEDIRAEFGPFTFETLAKTELIVKFPDGHRFRLLARGGEQKIRGRMWNGKRPDLIVCDDLEDDEQVENKDRRNKFRRWFFRAAKQSLGKGGRIRVHGTILHEDSLLNRLRKNSAWKHLFYKAHNAFDDFSEILWPQRWSEAELRAKRQEFIDDGDSAGYAQEMLNDPQDNAESYLRRDDFIPMTERDYERPKQLCVGADFAVSKADMANRTSFTVGGKDNQNTVHHLDFYVGRWSTTVSKAEAENGEQGWIDVMFDIQKRYSPDVFFVEGGVIWKSVERIVYEEMRTRDVYFNIEVLQPVKDKAARGRSFQKRHRAGATRWNVRASGYEGAKEEMLKFTGSSVARLDDQFDSAATLHLGIDKLAFVEEDDFEDEDYFEMKRAKPGSDGRSGVTGY